MYSKTLQPKAAQLKVLRFLAFFGLKKRFEKKIIIRIFKQTSINFTLFSQFRKHFDFIAKKILFFSQTECFLPNILKPIVL